MSTGAFYYLRCILTSNIHKCIISVLRCLFHYRSWRWLCSLSIQERKPDLTSEIMAFRDYLLSSTISDTLDVWELKGFLAKWIFVFIIMINFDLSNHILLGRSGTSNCTKDSSCFWSSAVNAGNQSKFSKHCLFLVSYEGI